MTDIGDNFSHSELAEMFHSKEMVGAENISFGPSTIMVELEDGTRVFKILDFEDCIEMTIQLTIAACGEPMNFVKTESEEDPFLDCVGIVGFTEDDTTGIYIGENGKIFVSSLTNEDLKENLKNISKRLFGIRGSYE